VSFYLCISESVQQRTANSTIAELEVAIKEWLRRSGDRIRGAITHKKNNSS